MLYSHVEPRSLERGGLQPDTVSVLVLEANFKPANFLPILKHYHAPITNVHSLEGAHPMHIQWFLEKYTSKIVKLLLLPGNSSLTVTP